MTIRTILCCDDDADDIELIAEGIKAADPSISVEVAFNGKQALEKLAAMNAANDLPCLLVLDINMPILTGKEVITSLREKHLYPDLRIVILTTSQNPGDLDFFSKHNIPFFIKPTNSKELDLLLSNISSFCAE